MTFSIKDYFATLSINDTQHKNTLYERHYVESPYAECNALFIVVVNVVMLSIMAPIRIMAYMLH
jgi:hypothetical protein